MNSLLKNRANSCHDRERVHLHEPSQHILFVILVLLNPVAHAGYVQHYHG